MSVLRRGGLLVKWGLAGIALLAVLAFAVNQAGAQGGGGAAQGGGQGGGRGQAPAQPENVLQGTIELHHHHDPDERARNMDIIDAALYARLKGMRGAVFKSHSQQTATTTWLAAKL